MKHDGKFAQSDSFYRIIMEAAAEGKPAMSTYKMVFVKKEDCFIEYPKFELWYDRFVQKMEVAVKMKKKENQQRSRLKFSDLTTDVISRVLDNLDVPSRLNARNTSKSLRVLVDSRSPKIKSITFHSLPKVMTVVFVDSNQKTSRFRYQDQNTPRGAHLYRAQRFLAPILKNRKLKLAELELENHLSSERFGKILKAQKSKIHVESLKASSDTLEVLLSTLQYLEPGILKNLEWNVSKIGGIQHFHKLFETQHWKNLESSKILGLTEFPAAAGIQNLFHLKRFEVRVNKITKELLEEIKDNLLGSAHFQSAVFQATDLKLDQEKILEFFGNFSKIFAVNFSIERADGRYFGCMGIQRI